MERIYGRHPVLEALVAEECLVKRVILAKGIRPDKTIAKIKWCAEQKGIRVETLDRKRLVSMTATAKHQGVLAEVELPSTKDIEDILQIARMRKEDPFILLLDGIEDPHNFGSILRSAEGMGVHGVIIGEHRQVKISPVVWKTSAGAAAYITVAVVTNLAQTMDILQKKHNLMCVGLEGDGSIPCHEIDFCQGLVLVVGGEGKGIRPILRKRCEMIVRIPIKGRIQSYNASVATAVMLFEIMCQREKIKKRLTK